MEFVCCSSDSLSSLENRYEGYCPLGQIPYVAVNSLEPLTCHMALSPCPTTAPYQCIYSAEKQNSYCCTPTTSHMSLAYHSRKLPAAQMHPTVSPNIQNNQLPPQNLPQLPSMLTGPNGENLNPSMIPIQLLSSATLPPALPGAPISGCPPTSQPLLNGETRTAHPCSTAARCPEGFTCYSNYPDGRNAQCCTSLPVNEDEAFARAMRPPISREPIKICPPGFIKIGSACKRSEFFNSKSHRVKVKIACEGSYIRIFQTLYHSY